MKLVVISDTHGQHDELHIPDGDVLIHGGDFTNAGSWDEAKDFRDYLDSLSHPHKIIIAGNHDFCMQDMPDEGLALFEGAHYLLDSSVTIDGVKFYGSPWQPWFFDFAFNLERGQQIRDKWELIEPDTDVLITHGPPLGYLDRVSGGEAVGCADLLEIVHDIKPRYHLFGHIHESYGVTRNEHTVFVNASSCDMHNTPVNSPVIIDIV